MLDLSVHTVREGAETEGASLVIPCMAVYDPHLMLQGGDPLATAYVTVKAVISIPRLWGGAAIGFLAVPLLWPRAGYRRAGGIPDRRRGRRSPIGSASLSPPCSPSTPGTNAGTAARGSRSRRCDRPLPRCRGARRRRGPRAPPPPARAFALAWMRSVERVRWEEDYRAVGDGLEPGEARVRGPGAGTEPPAGAVLEGAAGAAAGPTCRPYPS